ncbi:carbamoyltransferase N-terminal domain-containing protein [Umezawaea sp. Da 62-37]|uniref:carbamoyltransferase N-terminal domain-containing protein n=1 Tax=Umezawaea sp. Da 62-37 TaxID=3075927 RepID=UPI0028F71A30|nr:carbamoyltransferase N-terminal domain-containing protein [Umezawaea sp. Da 62-37]WNV85440.1 carbamoyltransferase N-terminal domain-containing protein [Umezawaea sp. Da 62-37]
MRICGIKASHDGGVAVIEDGRLLFSYEIEKLGNGERYSALGNLERVTEILAAEGLSPADIDQFVVDGWYTEDAEGKPAVTVDAGGVPVRLRVAPYLESPGDDGPLQRHTFDDRGFGDYASYTHVANHLIGTYCSSPFAARGEDAFVLVWDGIITPRLYLVRAATREVTFVEALMPVYGGSFAAFCARFEPYLCDTDDMTSDRAIRHHLSVAGKAMAYAAKGRVDTAAFAVFDDLMAEFADMPVDRVGILGDKVAANRDELMPGLSNADLIATYQAYLGHNLLERLTSAVRSRFPDGAHNLVLGGGCALNIKWNTAIRASGAFRDVFVPPFPNDAGAAIGTAACEMFRRGGTALEWDVHSGPRTTTGTLPDGWSARPCDERELAAVLHTEDEPVVVLSGRAELGPRALGNRSIIAPATSTRMKDRLNDIKNRAQYRPVAPICLEDRAPEVFTPGTPDPYMIFEHRMRPGWAERVPAIVHLDGTARLQTIPSTRDTATARILVAYAEISGIPLLCNTSANLEGRGFFPDVESAARWGGTRYIWSEGTLYTNPDRG